ncbi:sensor histidine kinase [Camelliibacillus cellulosilyticus]|uniref:histidine kinase n=1 Tax=Camelliibacillus cellulosilyticus TaxID=2174486 RepID=A0ABV9GKV6_9BACL
MFRRLHLQLTLLSTIVTSIIVLVMTFFLSYVSESNLSKNEYVNFLTRADNVNAYLKSQTIITTEWLAEQEDSGKLILYIEDNGIPIQYDEVTNAKNKRLIEEVKQTAKKKYHLNIEEKDATQVVTKQTKFTAYDHQHEKYYASVVYIPKDHGFLGVIALYPLKQYHQAIVIQRLIYIGVDIATIIGLWFFSYFFTKRMLRPIETSQKNQVEFISLASHELRSPLTVIHSSLSAIKKADSGQAARFYQIIESETKRMSRLVQDMLSLASADNATWTLDMQQTDMNTLLLNAFDAFQPLAKEKDIDLSFSFPDEPLPSCRCDRQRIEQVLSILLDNAISYTPHGGKVKMAVTLKQRKLWIQVADNGMGISDENKKKIFHRFYRIDRAHHNKEHFGLGLCIAYEIVKLHKGNLTVSDTPGGGATFTFFLPIQGESSPL